MYPNYYVYVKLVSPNKKESQLIGAVSGYPGQIWGVTDDLDELPIAEFGDHVFSFWVDGPPYRWIEFLPVGGADVKLAVTSGRIYLQDGDSKTLESVS